MGITSALVLFAVIWFMTLFVVLPLRLTTQGDAGKITPGTMAGSPAHLAMRRKLVLVTLVSVVLWAVIAGIIVSGLISMCQIDVFDRMNCAGPEAAG